MRRCPLPDRKQCPGDAIKQRGVRTDGKSEQGTVLALKNCLRAAAASVVNIYSSKSSASDSFLPIRPTPACITTLQIFEREETKAQLVFSVILDENNWLSIKSKKYVWGYLRAHRLLWTFRKGCNNLKLIFMDFSSWKFTSRRILALYQHCFISLYHQV